MAFVDDSNSNQAPQQIAGSAPLSQGSTPAASQGQAGDSTGGSGGTPMQSNGQPTQGSTGTNRGSGKASSGAYTNIQKYVSKNQPQAQNMAAAVTQNVEKQAGSIQNIAQQKKQDQQNLIDQNNQIMNQQKKEAANIINQQTGLQVAGYEAPQNQPAQPAQQDQEAQAKRFQELMQGPQGTANVGALNLADQQNKANALQQLAASGRTEQGRRNMLKDTFQKQGAYTQGMSGLDNLIVGGDAGAREAIVQGTDQAGRALLQNLAGINQQGQEALGSYQDTAGQFGEQVSGMAGNLSGNIYGDIENRLTEAKTAREQQISQLQDTITQNEERARALQGIYGQYNPDTNYGMFSVNPWSGSFGYNNLQADQIAGEGGVNPWDQINYINPDQLTKSQYFDKYKLEANDLSMLGLDPTQVASSLGGSKEYQTYGIGGFGNVGEQEIAKQKRDIYNALKNFKTNQVTGELSNLGFSADQLAAQSDLTLANVAQEDELNKYNTLQKLLGKSGIAPETRKDYMDQTELQNFLNKYNTNPAAGQVRTGAPATNNKVLE